MPSFWLRAQASHSLKSLSGCAEGMNKTLVFSQKVETGANFFTGSKLNFELKNRRNANRCRARRVVGGWRFGDGFYADVAASTRPIFNNERLAKALRQ